MNEKSFARGNTRSLFHDLPTGLQAPSLAAMQFPKEAEPVHQRLAKVTALPVTSTCGSRLLCSVPLNLGRIINQVTPAAKALSHEAARRCTGSGVPMPCSRCYVAAICAEGDARQRS